MKEIHPVDRRVGERLRHRREQLQIVQSKLAEAAGITFQQIQKYEKGINRISASRLQAFCRILSVTPSYFFDASAGSALRASHLDLYASLAEPDCARLNEAFVRIKAPEIRRMIIALIEALGSDSANELAEVEDAQNSKRATKRRGTADLRNS